MYIWNLFFLYFGGWTLQNRVFSNQKQDIYIYYYTWATQEAPVLQEVLAEKY